MKHVHTCDSSMYSKSISKPNGNVFFSRAKCAISIDALSDGEDENGTDNVAEKKSTKETSSELSITYRFRTYMHPFIHATDFTDVGIVYSAQNSQKEASNRKLVLLRYSSLAS